MASESILESVPSPATSPALARALPYVKYGASIILSSSLVVFRACFTTLRFIARIVTHPIVFLSPFPLLLYILAPIIVFVQILLDVAVYSPYRAVVYMADAFHPAYVFLGVACIVGALVGLSGRLTVLGITYLFPPPPRPLLRDAPEEKPRRIS
ncbi:hypothetical protein DFH09DRAFT_1373013 [Mycena vulgaris]|nr:hypothetical protein DFH09DRAFT_1048681 [Mycena vulgaris]KAJ6521569.1 hypothetical protein DFH09DRAFT_1373013 [Mycena vulgaris]